MGFIYLFILFLPLESAGQDRESDKWFHVNERIVKNLGVEADDVAFNSAEPLRRGSWKRSQDLWVPFISSHVNGPSTREPFDVARHLR